MPCSTSFYIRDLSIFGFGNPRGGGGVPGTSAEGPLGTQRLRVGFTLSRCWLPRALTV